jgi:four helix bundle protein
MPNTQIDFNLERRAKKFSKDIIDFARSIRIDDITRPLIRQLIRAGTSIGANYSEADEAASKKDFINKLAIANKEAKETRYWLDLFIDNVPESVFAAKALLQEATELNLIFSAIIRNTKKNNNL